jgi:hypothetical protein
MPDLAGLDDEDWRITVPCGFVWPQVIRNLASRVGSVQEEATGQLALVAELGQPARRLAIKWVATRLLPFKRVINKASILEHFLITAVSSLTAYEYQVAGFHRKFACDGYGDVVRLLPHTPISLTLSLSQTNTTPHNKHRLCT